MRALTASEVVQAMQNTSPKARPFIWMRESIASEMFSFAPDEVLELAPDALDWPAEPPFMRWCEPRADGTRLAEALIEKPGWCKRTTLIDPKTFRATPPPPQPKPELIDKAAILKRLRWSEAQFSEAQRFGFPTSSVRRSRYNPGDGSTRYTVLWRLDDVVLWAARHAAIGRAIHA